MIEVWVPWLGACVLVLFGLCFVWPSSRLPSSSSTSSFSLSVRLWLFPASAVLAAAGGLLLCLLVAATAHAADTTRTHCAVANFWPSVSAAVGNNQPEIFVWRLAVALHNVFVMADPLLFLARIPQSSRVSVVLTRVWALSKSMSCMGLFVLTFLSSTENYLMHEFGFLAWIVFGATALILMTFQVYPSSSRPATSKEMYAWRWNRNCLMVYLLSLCGCGIT